MLTRTELEKTVRLLLSRYHAEYAILFGSYARGEATAESDVDIVVFGGEHFRKTNIFSFAEDLRELTGKNVDAFEISEVDPNSAFYDSIHREGVKIA